MKILTIGFAFRVAVAIVLLSKLASGQTVVKPTYTSLTEEAEKGKKELEEVRIKHSGETKVYFAERRSATGATSKHRVVDFAWKEIAVKLFNMETGEVRIIKVKRAGPDLVNVAKNFTLEVEERPSGLRWNSFNTPFKVTKPEGWVVIANKYRVRLSNGRYRDVIYSPYSTSLHNQEMVAEGKKYLRDTLKQSFAELDRLGQGVSAKFLLDLKSEWLVDAMERLVLIEHTDPFDANQFKEGKLELSPYERVLTIIAVNRDGAYVKTSSPARASGLMQYTGRTWELIRARYRWAKLPSFSNGVGNHIQSMKAAVLLHNHNLTEMARVLGPDISSDPNLEHYLAAAYNGGVGPVIQAVVAHRKTGNDWRKELRKRKRTSESLDYMDKLDFLISQRWLDLPIWGVF